jgi:hypothetical protein
MRQIDLQLAFLGACPVAEDLQDQTGPVDHLGLQAAFQVPLLNGRQRDDR